MSDSHLYGPNFGELFNEPWMDRIDPHLLYRFWTVKGCPLPLKTVEHGTELIHYNTSFGLMCVNRLPPILGAYCGARLTFN